MKGADWRHPYGPKSNINGPRQSPGRARRVRRCARPTPDGPARSCRPRPSGSSPRAAGSTAPSMPGATSSCPAAASWPTPGRASFRWQNLCDDGYERTSPVAAFPANGYGLHDMIGNVWEWTTDWYRSPHTADAPKACCIPENPRGGARETRATTRRSRDPDSAQGHEGRLASLRAELLPPLPAGRAPREPVDTSTSHVGFPLHHQRQERLMSNDPSSDKPEMFNAERHRIEPAQPAAERHLAGGRVGVEPNRPRYHGASAATDAGSGATLRSGVRTSSSSSATMSALRTSAPTPTA